MSDHLGPCRTFLPEDLPALSTLVQHSGISGPSWRQLTDIQQISTRNAGKSGCSYFACIFPTLEGAVTVMQRIHKAMPNVNCELSLAPDGTYDEGFGHSSYSMAAWEDAMEYTPKTGFSCILLVDVQNLHRFGRTMPRQNFIYVRRK